MRGEGVPATRPPKGPERDAVPRDYVRAGSDFRRARSRSGGEHWRVGRDGEERQGRGGG